MKFLVSFFILLMSFSAIQADSVKCGLWINESKEYVKSHKEGKILDAEFITLIENKGIIECKDYNKNSHKILGIFAYYSKIKKNKDFDIAREVLQDILANKSVSREKIYSFLDALNRRKFVVKKSKKLDIVYACDLSKIFIQIGWTPKKKDLNGDDISSKTMLKVFELIKRSRVIDLSNIFNRCNN